jgi:hypothetical protein
MIRTSPNVIRKVTAAIIGTPIIGLIVVRLNVNPKNPL